MTRSSPKMLPKSRSDSESTREMMADDFDRQHDRRDEERRARRRGEVLQVCAEPLLLHALNVVIDRDRERAAERDVDVAGRRLQAGHKAHQVARQDEHEHRRHDREVARALVADVVVEHRLDRAQAVFDEDLQLAGLLDAEAAADDEAQHRPGDRR